MTASSEMHSRDPIARTPSLLWRRSHLVGAARDAAPLAQGGCLTERHLNSWFALGEQQSHSPQWVHRCRFWLEAAARREPQYCWILDRGSLLSYALAMLRER